MSICACIWLFLLTKCQRMDVFHFKVPPSAKIKPNQKQKTKPNGWALCSKTNGCSGSPKQFVLKHLYVHIIFFLIRKIKANFLFVDQMLGGLTARWAPPEKFCSWDTFQRKVACQIKYIKIFWMTSCLIQNNQGLDLAKSGKQKH